MLYVLFNVKRKIRVSKINDASQATAMSIFGVHFLGLALYNEIPADSRTALKLDI